MNWWLEFVQRAVHFKRNERNELLAEQIQAITHEVEALKSLKTQEDSTNVQRQKQTGNWIFLQWKLHLTKLNLTKLEFTLKLLSLFFLPFFKIWGNYAAKMSLNMLQNISKRMLSPSWSWFRQVLLKILQMKEASLQKT